GIIQDKAIAKCDTWQKHQALINLCYQRNAAFFRSYITVLRKKYKTSNWNEGRSADIQATAFIKYYFNTTNRDDKNILLQEVQGRCPLRGLFQLDNMPRTMSERNQLKREQKQIISILAKDCKLNAGQQDILSVSILRVKPASKNDKLYSKLVVIVSVIIAILVIVLVILLATMRTSSPTDSGDGTAEENPAAAENDTKTDPAKPTSPKPAQSAKPKAAGQETQEKKTKQQSSTPNSDAIPANNKSGSSTSTSKPAPTPKEKSNSGVVPNSK
ncbi:MAG: hypothetical protein Q4G59_09380, partial [Planctomycetia bacterium]|nr:hypothetical protein [Planctomycetia bacterium]